MRDYESIEKYGNHNVATWNFCQIIEEAQMDFTVKFNKFDKMLISIVFLTTFTII